MYKGRFLAKKIMEKWSQNFFMNEKPILFCAFKVSFCPLNKVSFYPLQKALLKCETGAGATEGPLASYYIIIYIIHMECMTECGSSNTTSVG